MTALYLIRHPAVAVASGVCYGASDVALCDDPAERATELWAELAAAGALGERSLSDALIVSSPLQRCHRLAAHLARCAGLPLQTDARLQEMDFGRWELMPFDAIGRAQIDAWACDPFGFCVPGGESGAAMCERVLAALDDWLSQRVSSLVIVSHGGPLRVIAGHVRGLPRERWLAQAFAYASLTCLQVGAV